MLLFDNNRYFTFIKPPLNAKAVFEDEKWFLVVNGATTEKDAAHLKKYAQCAQLFEDVSQKTAKLDLQGPLSREILSKLVENIEKLNYYTFDFFDCLGENVIISRTGYTGELGYEIYYPWDKVPALWKEILTNHQVKPAGLGARDVLRIEMGYSLYGHELGEEFTPLESGLSRFVDLEKDFIGREALLKQKKEKELSRKIIGFISESRRSPRAGVKIYSEKDEEIGIVTSGTFSPSRKNGIGLGFISYDYSEKGTRIFIGDDKNKFPAVISNKTFYNNGSLKK